MNKPRISVIIPVLNQAGKIEQCLKAVFSQPLPPHEVIIVDGHSTDGTVEIAQRFPVKVFYQEHGAAGAARQIGVDNAEGEYVAFTDADCIPDQHWLKSLLSEFSGDIVGVGGGMKNTGRGIEFDYSCMHSFEEGWGMHVVIGQPGKVSTVTHIQQCIHVFYFAFVFGMVDEIDSVIIDAKEVGRKFFFGEVVADNDFKIRKCLAKDGLKAFCQHSLSVISRNTD